MKIAVISIQRKITFFMLYLIVIGFGLFSLSRLKIDLLPDIKFPVIGIIVEYQGVGPADIENLITRPIEETVAATKNVKQIDSQSSQGYSIVLLQFNWGTDIDKAENNVRKRLDLVRDFLPDEASDPLVFAFDPSLQPIMFLGLNSKYLGPAELRKLADEHVEPLLERVEGVAAATTMGGLERQINVKVDPVRLAALHLSISDLVRAIQLQTSLQPAGRVETPTTNFSLRTRSDFTRIEDVKNVIVARSARGTVYLKDVAQVEDGFKERFGDVRVNYRPGVAIQINKQSDANTVQSCRNIRKALPQIQSILPEGTQITVIYDASEFIMRSILNLRNTGLQAFVLSLLVLLVFIRNIRGSLIMAVSIPVSIISTFAVMYAANLTLNIISMAGLALAIGMLVDNSIVVLENIYRHREMGEPLLQSADVGTTEVGMAITASTLTTISVFLPVLFIPDIAGELFSDMVIVICFSLLVSLILALTLIPLLSHEIMRVPRMDRIFPAQDRLKTTLENGYRRFEQWYHRILDWSLQHRGKVLAGVTALFVLAVILAFSLAGEFLPHTDQNLIIARIDREVGTPLEETENTVLQIEQIVRQEVPEAENVYMTFGATEGIAALFMGTGSHNIFLRIRLTPMENRDRTQFEIQDALRARFKEIPGLRVEFIQAGMFSTQREVEVKILGYDLQRGREIAEQIKRGMEKIPGLVDISLNIRQGSPELQIIPRRERLNDVGLTVFQLASIISTAIQGKVAARYRSGAEEYDIRVQLAKPYRQSKAALANLIIPLPSGKNVPLEQLADIQTGIAPSTIFRENQQRVISVGCDLSGTDLSTAVREIQRVIRQTPVPSDFQILIGGTAKDQRTSFRYLRLAFLAAILLVYMVMASQFESLIDPFIIFFTIPLAFIGAIFMLFITGTSMNVMSLVGLVMLVGIVV
ncbi:MAG TPA: efflux RND transporter permease subunit, partial [Calditrichae bacterium]|nr:efflux RND transporter permease subunit [Calditrichia bacterium]